jgi:Mn2+/Fe2+ NRAMP family transporter
MIKKIGIFLASIGPGLFLVGYNIGTGSVTTMASAGASHGMMLAWAVLLSCIFTYFIIVIFGRFTLVTGETALNSFKKHFGNWAAVFVLVILVFTEMVSSVGVMAIVTEVANEWTKPLTSSGEGFSTIWLTLIFASTIVFLLFSGQYQSVEKILALFVTIMGVCFILTSFMVIPEPTAVIKGLVPNIPDAANAGLVVAGMIGTTMGGIIFVTRSITVREKNWSIKDLRLEKLDAKVSVILMFILSASIMAAAAGTMHPMGLSVESAVDMVKTLEPLAGRFAISIFVAGIICAGLSSLIPHYMLVPLLLADYQNEKLILQKWRNRGIVLFYASLGFVIPVFGGRPVVVLIASQAFTLVVTPIVLILMIILQNRGKLMGDYKASIFTNIVLIVAIIFTSVMSVIGLIGIWEIL